MKMPGNSEDKLFWCIVASIILFFIKGGLVVIAIIWIGFFFITIPTETKRSDRAKEYAELQRHPNKYKAALLHIKDICTDGLEFNQFRRSSLEWWLKETDPEVREYIRKTPYYNHKYFENVKSLDSHLTENDRKYITLVNKIGKDNMKEINYAYKLATGEFHATKDRMEHWWSCKVTPEARNIIRQMEWYNNIHFSIIQEYDKQSKKHGLLPEHDNHLIEKFIKV